MKSFQCWIKDSGKSGAYVVQAESVNHLKELRFKRQVLNIQARGVCKDINTKTVAVICLPAARTTGIKAAGTSTQRQKQEAQHFFDCAVLPDKRYKA